MDRTANVRALGSRPRRFRAMRGPFPALVVTLALACLCLCVDPAFIESTARGRLSAAEESRPRSATDTRDEPTAWQDDATLRVLACSEGPRQLAAGDLGAAWRSDDAGATWQWIALPPADRALCGPLSRELLTWEAAAWSGTGCCWLAGALEATGSRPSRGVLAASTNGGLTWSWLPSRAVVRTATGTDDLPGIVAIQFFSGDTDEPLEGIAVCQPTETIPSGLITTSDGGLSWRVVPGVAASAWTAGVLIDPSMAVLSGRPGRIGLLGGDQLLDARLPALGRRAITDVAAAGPDSVWLVGDGGLALQSTNGGVSWQEPAGELPQAAREHIEFQAVAVRNDEVWLAGSPGSVIVHSADGGRSWSLQRTGQSLPIHALAVQDEGTVLAAGSAGTILRCSAEGQTWSAVRGRDRRAAYLQLAARSSQLELMSAAQLGRLQGYRGAAWVAMRDEPTGPAATIRDLQHLQRAWTTAGGCEGRALWRLALDEPDLARDGSALTERWQAQTEQRLGPTLIATLVRELRTWRPDLVLLQEPARDDAAAQLLHQATSLAITQAADPTRLTELRELGLEPWHVRLVGYHQPSAATGEVTIDPFRLLDGELTSLASVAARGRQYLADTSSLHSEVAAGPSSDRREPLFAPPACYRFELPPSESNAVATSAAGAASSAAGQGRAWFSGQLYLPGSDCRRPHTPTAQIDSAQRERVASRQRQVSMLLGQGLANPEGALSTVTHLHKLTDAMPRPMATALQAGLWRELVQRGDWEAAEATALDYLERFPQDEAAPDMAEWLLQTSASQELTWWRTQQARAMEPSSPDLATQLKQGSSVVLAGHQQASELESAARYRGLVELATKALAATDPARVSSPSLTWSRAAFARRMKQTTQADALIRALPGGAPGTPGRLRFDREIWLMQQSDELPPGIVACRITPGSRPHLDGVLSDPCWTTASEVVLADASTRSAEPDAARTLLLFAADEEYLYLAARCGRPQVLPQMPPHGGERAYDENLVGQDRLTIALDLDRDYATSFVFSVDQRGKTSDACCADRRYNPRYFVAVEPDRDAWRLELAIPWSALGATPPSRAEAWGVAVTRTIPGTGWQTLAGPRQAAQVPESFGVLRFQ